jgi:nucleotide-binding universal stress UspA family protein
VRNLIVGYGESDEGRDALALSRLLAEPGAAGITIVHVTPDDSSDRVGVAYVATAEAALALAEARKLSAETGASLRVLTVVPPVSPGQVGLGPDAHRFLYEAHERNLDAAINELRDKHGVEAEGRLLEGNPVEVLTEQSADELDLLLIGSRGYGPARRVLLGGVSTGVTRQARCPVIVVPRSASRAADGSRTVKEKATA